MAHRRPAAASLQLLVLAAAGALLLPSLAAARTAARAPHPRAAAAAARTLLAAAAPATTDSKAYSPAALADRVDPDALPGVSRSRPLDFPLFAGYIRVDDDGGADGASAANSDAGRALYYVLAESADAPDNPGSLVLWMNGGPGCSSVGGGLLSEQGPFFPRRLPQPSSFDNEVEASPPPAPSFALDPNPHAWNRGGTNASIVFVESPAFVGFSYSNSTRDAVVGDVRTARDAATFLRRFVERFPKYKGVPLYLSGESYAGHYVPTLAAEVLRVNAAVAKAEEEEGKAKGGGGSGQAAAAPSSSSAAAAAALPTVAAPATALPLKGFLLGNPWTDAETDNGGALDYWYSHAMISAEARDAVRAACDMRTAGPLLLQSRAARASSALFAASRASASAIAAGARVDEACDAALERAMRESGDINIYSVYKPVCKEPGEAYEGWDPDAADNGGGGGEGDDDENRRLLPPSSGAGARAGTAGASSSSPHRRPRSPMASQFARAAGEDAASCSGSGDSAAAAAAAGPGRRRGRGRRQANPITLASGARAPSSGLKQHSPKRRRYDPCIGDEVEAFLNDARVQAALHADPSLGAIPGGSRGDDPPKSGWSDCTGRIDYSRADLLSSMLPLYARLTGIPDDKVPSEALLGNAAAGGVWGGEEGRWAPEALAAAAAAAAASHKNGSSGGESGADSDDSDSDSAIRAGWLEAAAASALRMWVYSGDTDGIVPVLGTRRWVEALGLPVDRAWRSWDDEAGQVGGRRVDFSPGGAGAGAGAGAAAGAERPRDPRLSFVTVRAAGHMVPYDQPARAQQLLRDYLLEGEALGERAAALKAAGGGGAGAAADAADADAAAASAADAAADAASAVAAAAAQQQV